jgi:hypothetical protein
MPAISSGITHAEDEWLTAIRGPHGLIVEGGRVPYRLVQYLREFYRMT